MVLLVAMLATYLLSLGPVLVWVTRLPEPEKASKFVTPLYRPVLLIADESSRFRVIMRWYVNLWVDFPDFLA
jgi:hypothetical protein